MDQEEPSSSIISTINPTIESSDSNNILHQPNIAASKRPRHENEIIVANNNVTKYKGVVPQQNGHWGAQIYANHHRFWLGTFKSEMEAAMAYDSAAIKLRSGDSHRNFPWTAHTVQENNFQTQFSSEAVLRMIRDGSYQPKLQEFLRIQREKGKTGPFNNPNRVHVRDGKFTCVQLFEKELTPSDVGKLNRLVIPKKFAVKYLPYVPEDNAPGVGVGDMELVFYDERLNKSWSFRYSYWKSSQSYVFTRGWNRFVKEKKLKEGDVVRFYTCMSRLGHSLAYMPNYLNYTIDVSYASDDHQGQDAVARAVDPSQERVNAMGLELGPQDFGTQLGKEDDDQDAKMQEESNIKNEKGFRLFGVFIEDGNLSH